MKCDSTKTKKKPPLWVFACEKRTPNIRGLTSCQTSRTRQRHLENRTDVGSILLHISVLQHIQRGLSLKAHHDTRHHNIEPTFRFKWGHHLFGRGKAWTTWQQGCGGRWWLERRQQRGGTRRWAECARVMRWRLCDGTAWGWQAPEFARAQDVTLRECMSSWKFCYTLSEVVSKDEVSSFQSHFYRSVRRTPTRSFAFWIFCYFFFFPFCHAFHISLLHSSLFCVSSRWAV